jgi:Cu/Ag efflux pump CusA
MPQVIIEYNRPLIAQYHLSISDINRIVNAAFAGQSTGLVLKVKNVLIWLSVSILKTVKML